MQLDEGTRSVESINVADQRLKLMHFIALHDPGFDPSRADNINAKLARCCI